MSFDQAVYSFQYSGGEPPTPTRTPTSPSFFLSSFETPRQDSRNNSQNSPAWGSSFANALSPSFKTPNFATFSPLTPTGQAPSAARDVEAQIATHEHFSQAAHSNSQPESSNLAQGFEPFDLSGLGQENEDPQDSLKASIDTNVSSAGSMQTPPPTSTSASRRKAQQAQVARLTQETASKGNRRMSTPATAYAEQQAKPPNALLEESPLPFPNLQFSPDGFSFPMSGPATAPVYPQHKLFWDPDQNASGMSMDMPMDDTFNAFGITSQKLSDPFAPENVGLPSFSTEPSAAALQQLVTQTSHMPALNQTSTSSSSAMLTKGSSARKNKGLVVDPSVLFSSPSRALDISNTAPFDEPRDESMLPYAHQVREAKEDKELRAQKSKRKRPPELGESPAVTAATAALRDDDTNSTKSSPVIADSFFGALENGPPQLEGALPSRKRMTPDNHYKKQGASSNVGRRRSHKPSSQQPAVSFKIDESGRAVAQPSFAKGSAMDVDSDSESSDESSTSSNEMALSRHNSQRQSKATGRKARFSDNVYAHSQRSSDASTLASGRPGSRMQGKLSMNAGHAQVHFQSSQPLVTFDQESEVSTIVDSDEDRGDAQTELRKLVRQGSFGKKTNKRASWSSMNHQGKSDRRSSHAGETRTKSSLKPYTTPNSHRFTEIHADSSPTTITDPNVTPGSNLSGGSTRCICGMADGNGLMIQCESCQKWLHTSCVGLQRNEVPDVYLCNFCTNTPRAVRGRGGQRVEGRQPQRAMFAPPSLGGHQSPLGYKSRG